MTTADVQTPGLPRPGWWALSLAVHACALGAALLAPDERRAPPPAEPVPVRVVWIEPAPPPAPARGVRAAPADRTAERTRPSLTRVAPPSVAPAPPAPVARKPRAPRPEPAATAPTDTASPPVAAPAGRGEPAGTIGGSGDTPGGARNGEAGGRIGGRGDGPIPAAQAASPPGLVDHVPPEYPRRARARGVEGLVLLEVVIGRDGRVESAPKVLGSVPMLDEAAVAAVRRWRFRPARDADGAPIRVVMEIPVRFVLR